MSPKAQNDSVIDRAFPVLLDWEKGLAKAPLQNAAIIARAHHGAVELSFGQERLWFLAQLDSGSAAYNIPMAWRITGHLHLDCLQLSLDQLVTRHEALRTIFPNKTGEPRQMVQSPQTVRLEASDLRGFENSRRRSELESRIQDTAKMPFNLAAGPVWRVALFRMAEDQYVFVLVVHHIACDSPSIAIMLEELALLYRGFVLETPAQIPQSPVQYADFAIWQRKALARNARDVPLAYWREQLRGLPPALDFSSGRRFGVIPGFNGEVVYRDIPRKLSEHFRSLGRQHDVTRFMALLALFQVLLARLTGQEDIAVGCPMTHRSRAEVARVVGFFANMVVLRSHLSDNPTFRDLLRRTRQVVIGAYAHQDLPFEELLAELQPERIPGLNPFFQAMLVVEESAWRNLELVDAHCVPFPIHNGTAKFGLSLYVLDDREGFRLTLEYKSDWFDEPTVAGMLEHFENLMRAAIAEPDCRVYDLPLLSELGRAQALWKWNRPIRECLRADSVPSAFEAQVEQRPEAPALRCGNESLTYRELNSRANQLARHLVSWGARAEMLVAITLERSVDLVVALLAVMKTGAAYLPVDPSHPRERREDILRDSGAKILVTARVEDQGLLVNDGYVVFSLEDEKEAISLLSDRNLEISVQPDGLAYVIYTSGSTGRPKGVQIEHRNLSNFLASMRRSPGLSADDILLAVTTVGFDIAGLEIWLPLTTGASVFLASRTEASEPQGLIDLMEKARVTMMQATPATWEMLLAAGWKGRPQMKALCGGEALAGVLADRLIERCGSVWNMYGPTETTIWSSVHPAVAGEATIVPIGRPITNTTMFVLDRNQEPVPIGIQGELYIGGAGVARGYRNATELTAERFMADPFSANSCGRLYRTGDLVRQRRDGVFEFLGRLDRQVKLRGYRIEPAEIELALRSYPGVSQAGVTLREHAGDKQLVAYLVVTNESLPQEELRRYLAGKLPGYMVPATIVTLEKFPVTPNGKLDWTALSAPVKMREPSFVAPRGNAEVRLTKIWEKILDVSPIGVTDNFFDLGGHSILATRLFALVEKEFGKRLSLGTLFEAPTIEQLARIIGRAVWTSGSLIPLQFGESSTPPLFLVQARADYRALASELGCDQTVFIVPYDDLFFDDTDRSLPSLAEELSQRIRSRQPHGPYHLGGMCVAGRVAFAIASELYRQGEEVTFLGIIDMAAPKSVRLTRLQGLESFVKRLSWHLRYAMEANRQAKLDWALGLGRALNWQTRYCAWKLVRWFFWTIEQPLPRKFRHPTRLIDEAVAKDTTSTYPGRITLFRPAENTFVRYDQHDLGWGKIGCGGVEVYEIAGLKRTLLRENATQVGRHLRACLTRLQPSEQLPTGRTR